MALTTIQTNNKLVRYTQEINREFVRENLFSPYMGEEMNAIIRIRNELKQGGDTINLPIVRRLRSAIQSSGSTAAAIGSGTLVGSEEQIDNYGQRVKVDWARNAVLSNQAQQQMDSADIFGIAKPLLSDWGKELQRDELIQALMSLPNLSVAPGADIRINGLIYDNPGHTAATAAQRNQFNADNTDRLLFGSKTSNYSATHATALSNITAAAVDSFTGKNLSLLKRQAMNANPKIKPFKTRDGYEHYVAFCGTNAFRDLKNDLNYTATSGGGPNLLARSREGNQIDGAPNNPLFQDGDQLYDGVIVRCVPEISAMVTNQWTSLLTAGAVGTARVEPVFLCGQQAATLCWGQMAKPTFRKEDDYQFQEGVGIQMCYGVAKIAFLSNISGTAQVQFGMATGFFWSAAD